MLQRKWLIIFVVACFTVLQTTAFVLAAPSKGVVGYWHLDEGTGTVAKDSSPEGNDGELWGDAKWAEEGLSAGGGFTGTSLNLPSNSGLSIPAQGVESLEQITEGITLAAWIKITGDATDDQGNLIVKPGSYYLVYRDKKVGMYLYGPSSDGKLGYQTGETVLPENKWMHVALSFTKGKEIHTELIVRDRRFSKEEIKEMCNKAGLEVVWTRFVRAGRWQESLAECNHQAKEILLLCRRCP